MIGLGFKDPLFIFSIVLTTTTTTTTTMKMTIRPRRSWTLVLLLWCCFKCTFNQNSKGRYNNVRSVVTAFTANRVAAPTGRPQCRKNLLPSKTDFDKPFTPLQISNGGSDKTGTENVDDVDTSIGANESFEIETIVDLGIEMDEEDILLLSALSAATSTTTIPSTELSSPLPRSHYNWRTFFPKYHKRSTGGYSYHSDVEGGGSGSTIGFRTRIRDLAQWIVTGDSNEAQETNVQMKKSLGNLARVLILLRLYEQRYVDQEIPKKVVVQQQRRLIAEITQSLYSSGAPTWVLEPIMCRVHEGLTGLDGLQMLLLPNRGFIYYPSSEYLGRTQLVKMSPGFDISILSAVERVAVRLASFASNVASVERLSAKSFRKPKRNELDNIKEEEQWKTHNYIRQLDEDGVISPQFLAREILDLASETYGLFFFLNNKQFQLGVQDTAENDIFWEVSESSRQIFSALATQEASFAMKQIRERSNIVTVTISSSNASTVAVDDESPESLPLLEETHIVDSKLSNITMTPTEATKSAIKQQQQQRLDAFIRSPTATMISRIVSSAGACGLWFGGNFADMLVSAILAVCVSYIATLKKLAFEERVLTNVAASFFVGLVAGMLTFYKPNTFCFGAIALASVLDFMQGFKVLFASIEVMSKNTVTGTARFLEGILSTGLISYTLIFGLQFSARIMGVTLTSSDYTKILTSSHGISKKIYPLLLPLTSLAWSISFRPSSQDLPLMMFHGTMAMCLSWAGVPLFLAASAVTFSSAIISRITGKNALASTLAGLYALVPGTYMMGTLMTADKGGFIESLLLKAVTIGLGGWTGTILCSPIILGKASGLHGRLFKGKNDRQEPKSQDSMIYF